MDVSAATATAGDIRTDFMNLLVVQLQNQNPMEPLDNNEMASQLAQLSSLEQLENMNWTFREVLASQERLQAVALIGKEIEFIPEGSEETLTGRVDEVNVVDTGVRVTVGEHAIDLDAVRSIRD
jgi:flagellar basal-body rod modification protein FlgD